MTALVAISGPAAGAPLDVVTRTAEPERHRITVAELPPPDESSSVAKRPQVVAPPSPARLQAPAGFEVGEFASDLKGARWLVLTPEHDVLVTQKQGNVIFRLRDTDGDGVADSRSRFADEQNGLNLPFGIAFAGDSVFIANTDGVRRYSYQRGQDRLEGRGQQIHALPGGGYNQHWTRNVIVGPDGRRLYVSVGSESNASVEPLPRAAVLEMNLDGSASRVLASGLRNPIGLAFHPRSQELYVVVNERDRLGDRLVPDYFTRIQSGQFYGWPYAYFRPDLLDPRHTRDGRSTKPEIVAKTVAPDVLLEAHSAAIGLTFYRGQAFPERYRQGAFVALHGSWNRSRASGYKIVFIPFTSEHRPEGGYEDFVTGFVLDPDGPTVWGRPTGILELPDGSLLFSDDANDRIFRIRYAGSPGQSAGRVR